MHPELLVEAAGLVADGEALDWGSMSSRLSTEEERALAGELAALERIANEHRRLHHLLPGGDPTRDGRSAHATWGHLELVEVLGRGSYGIVYRAWDTRLERHVALKLFHNARDPEQVMREGRMLARIRHDNVVAVYGADIIDGVAGIWMDCVRGRTLEQIIKEQGPMSAQEATLVGLDLSRALAAVHTAELLHCDIKAQNVIREPGGRLVLMDLGAGRAAMPLNPEALTSDDLTGTPRYMAPELFQHRAVSRQSDIYSVGVLLFYLVSGRFPVDGKSLSEIRWAHADGKRKHLRDLRADLPTAFAREVGKALDTDPLERHQSAGELEAGLLRLLTPSTAVEEVKQPADDAPTTAEEAKKSEGRISRRGWTALAVAGGLIAALVAGSQFRGGGPAVTHSRTIAVLPIRNLTGDSGKNYIADGLTEVLISNLARVRSLSVPSLSAVMPYRDTDQPTKTIAQNLGANLLLAGSIIQIGDVVRIGVQLVDAGTDRVTWSQELVKPASELLAAQGEIARLVAAKLSIDLSGAEERGLRQRGLHPDAQEAYLRGLVAFQPGSDLKSADVAVQHFRHAVTLAPDFAPAWASLALAELRRIDLASGIDRASRAADVLRMAETAIRLDPTLETGYVALGTTQFYHQWDFAGAERSLRAALDHAPSSALAMQRFASLLSAMGRLPEAIALSEGGRNLEPLVVLRTTSLAMADYYARDFTRAESEMNRALEIQPGAPVAHFGLGRIYSAVGRHADAIEQLQLAVATNRTPAYLVELARVYVAAGEPANAQAVLAELQERAKRGEVSSLDNQAYIAAAAGRVDEAFAVLDEAVRQKLTNVLWIGVDPRADPLRKDPRFDTLLTQIGVGH